MLGGNLGSLLYGFFRDVYANFTRSHALTYYILLFNSTLLRSDIGGGGFWLAYNTILANSCGCQGNKIIFEFIADVFEQLRIKLVQLLVTVPTLLKKIN